MRRLATVLAAAPVLVLGGTATTAKPARKVGMVASIGGAVGLTTASALAWTADTDDVVLGFMRDEAIAKCFAAPE